MQELFILGRLRAPFEAVRDEVAALERRLALDSRAMLYVNDLLIVPIDGMSLYPEDFRDRFEGVLASGLFVDFAIGTLGRHIFAAAYTHLVDQYQGQTYTYGDESKVFRFRWHHSGHRVEVDEDESRRARAVANAEDIVGDDHEGWDEETDDYDFRVEPKIYTEVQGTFRTSGLLSWFARQPSPSAAGTGAILLVIVCRRDWQTFEASKDGQALMQELGPTTATLVRAESAACIAVRAPEGPSMLHARVQRYLRPRVIEDFIMFDIGSAIAAMHQGLSPLASWIERFIVRDEAAELEQLFKTRKQN